MAISNTFNFNPTIGSMALVAFSRCQVKRTEITPQHMEDCYMESNFLQSGWSADGITFWTVELVTQPITTGVQTYLVPSQAITVLDVYVNNGSYNRLLFPFSRTDFASLGNPQETGFPTSFWHDRSLTPTLTLWPVPDNNSIYTMGYYIYTQPQDANTKQGGNAAIPYYWLDAYLAELAYRLSRHYAPTLEAVRKQDAKDAYDRACKQVENAPMYITPGLSSYFRS